MTTEITDKIGRRVPGIDLLIALIPLLGVAMVARGWPAWAFMWAMAVAVWFAFKWMMWTDAKNLGPPSWTRAAGFFLGWAGTDAVPFRETLRTENPLKHDWLRAVGRALMGAGTIWIGVRLVINSSMHLAGWVGMIGTVLLLHFGLFEVIGLIWRRAGVGVEPLMDRPLHARSVADFWSRWNRGFRNLAYRKVFRPLHRRIGLAGAAFGTFCFSGLIHDLMISIPAGAGYGLPTLYFLIQFLAVMVERLPAIRNLHPLIRRLFTFAVVVGPVGILFHRDFVLNVFVPFLNVIGAT